MSFFGLKLGGKKKPIDKAVPKPTQPRPESTNSRLSQTFKEVWWIFALLLSVAFIAMVVMKYWDKIEPFIPIP